MCIRDRIYAIRGAAFDYLLKPIDKKGNKVIGGLSKAFLSNEGYRVIQKGSAFGAIDSTGAVVIPIEYTNSLTSVNNGRLRCV